MIRSLTGKNSYLLHQRLVQLTEEFIKKYGELSVEKVDAAEAEAPAVIEAAQALPFLAQRKLLVIRDLSQNPPATEKIEQIISSIPDSTDAVFYEPNIDRRGIAFKVLKSQTELEDFSELDAPALAKWLVAEAKKQAGDLSLADANYLVERVGANQTMLASELDKLISYEPKISHETIELLSEPTPQSRIFDLLDAAFKRDKKRALKLYAEQRAQKVEPQAILAMLAWQLRLLTIAQNRGRRSSLEVAKDFGISEYPLRKAAALADQMEPAKLKSLVHEALELDVKAKTTPMDLEEALKTYIVTL